MRARWPHYGTKRTPVGVTTPPKTPAIITDFTNTRLLKDNYFNKTGGALLF